LETHDSSLIAGIDNIIFPKDEIIIGAYFARAFMIYDRKGRWVKTVNKTGNRPDEYGLRLGTYIIDQSDPNNNIIMGKSPKMLYYDYHSWKRVKEAKWRGTSAILGSLPNGAFRLPPQKPNFCASSHNTIYL